MVQVISKLTVLSLLVGQISFAQALKIQSSQNETTQRTQTIQTVQTTKGQVTSLRTNQGLVLQKSTVQGSESKAQTALKVQQNAANIPGWHPEDGGILNENTTAVLNQSLSTLYYEAVAQGTGCDATKVANVLDGVKEGEAVIVTDSLAILCVESVSK